MKDSQDLFVVLQEEEPSTIEDQIRMLIEISGETSDPEEYELIQ